MKRFEKTKIFMLTTWQMRKDGLIYRVFLIAALI